MEGCIVPLIGMYPTLVIIVCAVDKSLYEKSSGDGEARKTSVVFAGTPPSRPRGTLSELLAAHTAEEDIGHLSEHSKNELNGPEP
ncbi:hypothetical protein C8T65DRAFT_676538 [Cerioporus squamosus]|nr:hypothetical protein C8T65DRAFT_676538 [Cerioporus squamosus]